MDLWLCLAVVFVPATGLEFLVRVPHSSLDQTPFNLCKVFLTCLGQFLASKLFFLTSLSILGSSCISFEMGSHITKTGFELIM